MRYFQTKEGATGSFPGLCDNLLAGKNPASLAEPSIWVRIPYASGAGNGNDRLLGRLGNDDLYAGWGRDKPFGHKGSDQLHGERGNDVLRGGAGRNQLYADTDGDAVADFGLRVLGVASLDAGDFVL